MADIQKGETYKLNRKTFLSDGVFVIQGTMVRVMEITEGEDAIIVQFQDREGFPHVVKGIQAEELEA